MSRDVAVTDAGPLHYLAAISATDVLSKLFHRVLVPQSVVTELSAPRAPLAVRSFITHSPAWLVPQNDPTSLAAVDTARRGAGERAAIALALEAKADVFLCDDLEARALARTAELKVIGTLGLLIDAGSKRLLNFDAALTNLTTRTNFRHSADLIAKVRAEFHQTRQSDRD